MSKRFYQVELTERPAFWDDLGERITLSGIILEGDGVRVTVLLPGARTPEEAMREAISQTTIRPTAEEWSELIQCSDDPKIIELDPTGGVKAIHRKLRFAISGVIQQKVWARDEYRCQYCMRRMGVVQLTIDHLMPLELGGANDTTNYLSACRKCNKRKGNIHPVEWCNTCNLDYVVLKEQAAKPLPT